MKIGEFIHNQKIFDIYDKDSVSIEEIFYIETLKKWNFLRKTDDFSFFQIETSTKNYNLKLNTDQINKKNSNTIIRNKQKRDILKIINKVKIEIIYILPQINNDNSYFINFVIIVKKNMTNSFVNSIKEINFELFICEKIINFSDFDLNYNLVKLLLSFNKNIFYDILPRKSNKINKNTYLEENFNLFCLQVFSFDFVNDSSLYDLDYIFGINFYQKNKSFSVYIENETLFFKDDEILKLSIYDFFIDLRLYQKSLLRN